MKIKNFIALLFISCCSASVFADNHEGELNTSVGGFIRFDIGAGDRYGDAHSSDALGISKAALAVTSSYKNVKGVFVLGGEALTINDGLGGNSGNVGIKDAFLVINIGSIDITTGAAPLFFGLKPDGYPGDRSIQGSVEYGAGGAFAVSNQAGPSAALKWNATKTESVHIGVFDQSPTDPAATSGSGIIDNALFQIRSTNIMSTGVYANFGFERRYVEVMDESKNIIVVGGGWMNKMIDISAEFVSLAKEIARTADNETYLIAEATFMPTTRSKVYLDFSNASELDLMTIRAGANYNYSKHTMFTLEYSYDDMGSANQNSVDGRITWSY